MSDVLSSYRQVGTRTREHQVMLCFHYKSGTLGIFPPPHPPPLPLNPQFSSVQSLSRIWLFGIPWTASCQASLSITNSRSLPKLISIELVMPSNHLILCHPLLLPSISPSTRVFSNESALRIRWPKYWSFSFDISPSNDFKDWFLLGWTGWISLQSNRLSRVLLQHQSSKVSILQHSAFFMVQLSHPYMTTGKTIALDKMDLCWQSNGKVT